MKQDELSRSLPAPTFCGSKILFMHLPALCEDVREQMNQTNFSCRACASAWSAFSGELWPSNKGSVQENTRSYVVAVLCLQQQGLPFLALFFILFVLLLSFSLARLKEE